MTLYLTLKAKYFDMIASGIKKEEYREVKWFWIKRLEGKSFDKVVFARGGHFHQSIKQITVECLGIRLGQGKEKWGAEKGVEYFVIELGKIL